MRHVGHVPGGPVIPLPPPPELERRCVALAMLDALLSPEWQYRYYSFNRLWDPVAGTRMASMRNGSGDEYFALFFPDGSAAIKGFAHESSALRGRPSIGGVLDGIPARFGQLLTHLAGTPQDYASFVDEYFEKRVEADVVARFFAHEPLSDELAAALHPDVDRSAPDDLDEIGYPIVGSSR